MKYAGYVTVLVAGGVILEPVGPDAVLDCGVGLEIEPVGHDAVLYCGAGVVI